MLEFTRDQLGEGAADVYRLLFERSPHPVLVVDAASLRVLSANDAAAREYSHAREELAGLPLQKLWPEAQEALVRRRTGNAGRRAAGASWRHLRKDGKAIDVAIDFQELPFAGRPALALHLRNVAERDLSAGLLEANGRLLELMARGSPLAMILDELVLAMEALSSGMIGSVLLLDEDAQRMRHGAAPSLPPHYRQAIDGLPIGPAAGSCGTAMYLDRDVIVADIAADPLWKDYRALALAHGLRACWSTPVRSSEGRVIGGVGMYYRETGGP